MRLDCVEALLRHSRCFAAVFAALKAFPDLDKMLAGLTVAAPKTVTVKTARQAIDTLIFLRQALRTAHVLADALDPLLTPPPPPPPPGAGGPRVPAGDAPAHPLLSALVRNLRSAPPHGGLGLLQQAVDGAFTEGTAYSRSALEMRHQVTFECSLVPLSLRPALLHRPTPLCPALPPAPQTRPPLLTPVIPVPLQECFAIRPGRHGLLDVSRKTFLSCVEVRG